MSVAGKRNAAGSVAGAARTAGYAFSIQYMSALEMRSALSHCVLCMMRFMSTRSRSETSEMTAMLAAMQSPRPVSAVQCGYGNFIH